LDFYLAIDSFSLCFTQAQVFVGLKSNSIKDALYIIRLYLYNYRSKLRKRKILSVDDLDRLSDGFERLLDDLPQDPDDLKRFLDDMGYRCLK